MSGENGLGVGKLEDNCGCCPWLVLGRDRAKDDAGREIEAIGSSKGKKLDFLRLGEGDGGICERVSMALSESDGLGPRVRVLDGGS